MDTLAILARVKANADYWGLVCGSYAVSMPQCVKVAEACAEDFRRIQHEIEKSLEEQADNMWKELLKAEQAKEREQ